MVRASIEWESARDGLAEVMRQVDEVIVDEVDEVLELDEALEDDREE